MVLLGKFVPYVSCLMNSAPLPLFFGLRINFSKSWPESHCTISNCKHWCFIPTVFKIQQNLFPAYGTLPDYSCLLYRGVRSLSIDKNKFLISFLIYSYDNQNTSPFIFWITVIHVYSIRPYITVFFTDQISFSPFFVFFIPLSFQSNNCIGGYSVSLSQYRFQYFWKSSCWYTV